MTRSDQRHARRGRPVDVGTPVLRVGDVATVSAGYEPRRQYGSVNGINGLFLQIQKTSDASEVDAPNNVLAALPRVRTQFPEINFNIINVQSKYTEQQLDSVMRTLLEGVVLTGIVMLFFLHSWRNAIVVLIAIPASLGVALFVMKMLGLTLDTISLLGMTLVVGILVDDSTVVLENIERHNEMGEPPMRRDHGPHRNRRRRDRHHARRRRRVLADLVHSEPDRAATFRICGRRRHRDAHLTLRLLYDHAVAGR